jgi:hypothetical protein
VACGMGGHEYFLKTAVNRLFLRCENCGHETPGWVIDVRPRRRPSATDNTLPFRLPRLRQLRECALRERA